MRNFLQFVCIDFAFMCGKNIIVHQPLARPFEQKSITKNRHMCVGDLH